MTWRRLLFGFTVTGLVLGIPLWMGQYPLIYFGAGWGTVWLLAMLVLRPYRGLLIRLPLLLLVFGVLAEGLFRWRYFGVAGLSFDRYRPAGYASPWSTFTYSEETVTGMKPHQVVRFKGARYTVNQHGFRGRDADWEKPANTYRVVVMGASAPMGAGVHDEEVVFARLETKLNGLGWPVQVEFINLSMGGASMGHMAYHLNHSGMRYDPDLILFFLDRVSFRTRLFEEVPLRVGGVDASLFARVNDPEFRFWASRSFFFQAMEGHIRRTQRDLLRRLLPQPARPKERRARGQFARQNFDQGFDRIREIAGDVPVAYYMFRPFGGTPFGDPPQRFESYLQQQVDAHGLRLLPLPREWDIPYQRTETILYPGDSHPNARMHGAIAEAFFPSLAQWIKADLAGGGRQGDD